ncbi:MAG: hypothetical protein KAX15_05490 [Candidatus Omnitrophica bacterium]|nr:hypothetical protein [Candidatus Omnitrophota bacterium]
MKVSKSFVVVVLVVLFLTAILRLSVLRSIDRERREWDQEVNTGARDGLVWFLENTRNNKRGEK